MFRDSFTHPRGFDCLRWKCIFREVLLVDFSDLSECGLSLSVPSFRDLPSGRLGHVAAQTTVQRNKQRLIIVDHSWKQVILRSCFPVNADAKPFKVDHQFGKLIQLKFLIKNNNEQINNNYWRTCTTLAEMNIVSYFDNLRWNIDSQVRQEIKDHRCC